MFILCDGEIYVPPDFISTSYYSLNSFFYSISWDLQTRSNLKVIQSNMESLN